MARIGIMGLGNWGTALARVWVHDGHDVGGWTIEDEVFASLRERGVNEKYLPGVDLSALRVSMDATEILAGCDLVGLSVPSGVILGVVDDLLPHLQPHHVLLDLAKGLAPGEQMISEAIEEKLKAAGLHNGLAVLTGPTIAPEVARGVLTTALVASEDLALAEQLAQTLSAPTLRLQPGTDPLGAELWGGFKNVIALACGVVDGLAGDGDEGGLGGDNLKAAVFTAGLREGYRLLPELGAQPETALGPAGVGDLFVTATSPHGRNRGLGEKLGRGQTLEQALGEMVMVAEGVRATRMFGERAVSAGVDAPFLRAVGRLLDGELDAETCLREIASGQA